MVPEYKTIGVMGGGIVGQATAKSLTEYSQVKLFDILPTKSTHSLSEVLDCDLVILCLPTDANLQFNFMEPSNDAIDRELYLKVAENFVSSKATVVVRSTIPIGTIDKMVSITPSLRDRIIHWPEFLTARTAFVDASIPSRHVCGAYDWNNTWCQRFLRFLKQRWPGTPQIQLSPKNSEAVKLFQNSFFAAKIAFFNELHTLAEKLELDWESILAAILADGRISPNHTQVPGPDGQYGFGGACLPKDLIQTFAEFVKQGMVNQSEPGDSDPLMIVATIVRNSKDRRRKVGAQ